MVNSTSVVKNTFNIDPIQSSSASSQNLFSTLPADIHRIILSQLPFTDRLSMSCATRNLRSRVAEIELSIQKEQLQTLRILLIKHIIQPNYQTLRNGCIAIIDAYGKPLQHPTTIKLAHNRFYENMKALIDLLKEMEEPDLIGLQRPFATLYKLDRIFHQLVLLPYTILILKRIERLPFPRTDLEVETYIQYMQELTWNGYPGKALELLDRFSTRGSENHTRILSRLVDKCCLRKEFGIAEQITRLMPVNAQHHGVNPIINNMIGANLLDQAECTLTTFSSVLEPNFIQGQQFPLALAFLKRSKPAKALSLLNQSDVPSPSLNRNQLLVELAIFILKKKGCTETLLFIENNIEKISDRESLYKGLLRGTSDAIYFNREFFIEIVNKFAQATPTLNQSIENLLLHSLIYKKHFKEALLLLLEQLDLDRVEWLSKLSLAFANQWMRGNASPFTGTLDFIHLIDDISIERPAILDLVSALLEHETSSNIDRFLSRAKELAQTELVDTPDRAYQSQAQLMIGKCLWNRGKKQEAFDAIEKIQDRTIQEEFIQTILSESPPIIKSLVEINLNTLPPSATFLDRIQAIAYLLN